MQARNKRTFWLRDAPYEQGDRVKIVNDKALKFARGPGFCDWCRKPVGNRNPHHVFSKGAGQVDIRCNIAAICETFSGGLHCHHLVHTGEIADGGILAMVAEREKCLQDDIRSLVMLIRRMPAIRYVDEELFRKFVAMELGHGAQKLALRELETFKHLLWRDS